MYIFVYILFMYVFVYNVHVYICIYCSCMYLYIHHLTLLIYIPLRMETSRNSTTHKAWYHSINMYSYVYIHMCIYICIHIHIHVYILHIHLYVYMFASVVKHSDISLCCVQFLIMYIYTIFAWVDLCTFCVVYIYRQYVNRRLVWK